MTEFYYKCLLLLFITAYWINSHWKSWQINADFKMALYMSVKCMRNLKNIFELAAFLLEDIDQLSAYDSSFMLIKYGSFFKSFYWNTKKSI